MLALTAGGMEAAERSSIFNPLIKCSSCGMEVALALMGEHYCTTEESVHFPTATRIIRPETMHSPASLDEFLLRPQRPRLPPIDPYASNRTRMYSGELTPVSSGQSSAVLSPRSTSSGQQSPWRRPPRKVSAPLPRRPPSPELSNLDCAFPPFPIASAHTKKKIRDSRLHNSETEGRRFQVDTESSVRSAASSPRSSRLPDSSLRNKRTVSVNSSKNRNAFAMRESGISIPPSTNHSRRPSVNSLSTSRKGSTDQIPPLPSHAPTIISNNLAIEGETVKSIDRCRELESLPETSLQNTLENIPAKLPIREEGQNQFAEELHLTSSPESTVPESRQELTPLTDAAANLSSSTTKVESSPRFFGSDKGKNKEPSYRAKRPSPIESGWNLPALRKSMKSLLSSKRAQTLTTPEKPNPEDFMPQHPPVPNSTTKNVNSDGPDPSQDIIPPTANAAGLTDSDPTQTIELDLAIPSPVRVPASTLDVTVPSSPASPGNIVMAYAALGYDEEESSVQRANGEDHDIHGNPLHASTGSIYSVRSISISEASSSSRSSVPAQTESPNTTPELTRPSNMSRLPMPQIRPVVMPRIPQLQADSPTDPLFQQGRLSPIPPSNNRRVFSDSTKTNHNASQRPSGTGRRKPLSTHKGTCRGCSSVILANQKSVCSADGRLTGRYHKECLVCRTCASPFSTADFYVLNDSPYCGQHYHELNGTLCGSCGKGIEGQFVETAAVADMPSQKFHTGCLSCTACRVHLQEVYFELNGRVYCEQDAHWIANLPSRSQFDNVPSRSSPLARELISPTTGSF